LYAFFGNNFLCSPLWKIVFQSRKHSWNFIAACFIKKAKRKNRRRSSRGGEKGDPEIVGRIFAERCNNKSFSRGVYNIYKQAENTTTSIATAILGYN